MAEIAFVKQARRGLIRFTWTGVTEGDTFQPLDSGDLESLPQEIGVDVGGTFGSGTLKFVVSNGVSSGVFAKDLSNTEIALTGDDNVSLMNIAISSLLPQLSGATGASINLVITVAV